MNGISLFAGIGGIDAGLRKYVRTVCYVEYDRYAAGVIMSRIRDGQLDDAPIWDDIRTFDGSGWRERVDVVFGGFPCQDISTAGKGAGIKTDTRSGLWFEMLRIIVEVRPTFVFVENVSALTNRGLDIVLGCLSQAGYDAKWTDLRASDVGAPHRRERMFILAYAKHDGWDAGEVGKCLITGSYDSTSGTNEPCEPSGRRDEPEDVADSDAEGLEGLQQKTQGRRKSSCSSGLRSGDAWKQDPADLDPASESFVGRVADGVPHRVDRLRCLGNAVVPEQAERAWEILMNVKHMEGVV
jgi:DNA (cytosine-5)-methyltransferase 1